MLYWMRWVRGYVNFSISGGPERFLNQCARCGITLWDMKGGAEAAASVYASQYKFLRRCARRAGCKLHMKKKAGFPFRAACFTKRRGLVLGAVLFAVMIQLLSQRVWCVDVQGNQALSTQQLEQELSSLGLRPGIAKKDVNPILLGQQIMQKIPQVRWVTVNTQDCVTHVVLEEKVEKPELDKSGGLYNLTAARVGQILRLEVYRGTAQVMLGEAVAEGQLLVSGIVEDSNGTASLQRAAGRVVAATTREWTTEIGLTRTLQEDCGGALVRRSVTLFGLRLPLSLSTQPQGEYRREDERVCVQINGVELPVSFYQETWTPQKEREIVVNQEQALVQAREELEKQLAAEWKNVKVMEREENVEVKNGMLFYRAVLKCEENIAIESEIFVN